ncbi:hypothetical protein RFI_11632, partial [Reticulomyxa filosa]
SEEPLKLVKISEVVNAATQTKTDKKVKAKAPQKPQLAAEETTNEGSLKYLQNAIATCLTKISETINLAAAEETDARVSKTASKNNKGVDNSMRTSDEKNADQNLALKEEKIRIYNNEKFDWR